MSGPVEPTGPDLAQGVPLTEIPEGALFAAHAFGKPFVVVRRGGEVRIVGGQCTHYGAPLADGLLVGDTVRCPWHHACFSLETGEALRAPALNPLPTCVVAVRDGRVFATREVEAADGATPPSDGTQPWSTPAAVVVVGGGAAGNAAAEMLRREGYTGPVTMVTADESLPYDRPNLSKDYLAGNAPADWIPLRSAEFYRSHQIDVVAGARATAIDVSARQVVLEGGRRIGFDRLLLATGADPVRLSLPGGDLPHVHYLRTLGDSGRLIDAAKAARTVVVMGASFIGLEVAAALRTRGLAVHVVAPEAQPLEKVMGPQVGAFVRSLHEKKGVVFHLGQSATAIDASSVTLKSGERVAADLVVIGVGVRPSVALAEAAGLAMDRGVRVNEYLETSTPGIFAAGDIARWPDRHTGTAIRVEHWVVAERQGQTAARNMLGRREAFDAVPFFWSAHYDTTITYVGHAERWTEVAIDGDLSAGAATVRLNDGGKTLAVITVGRDLESLRAEAAMEEAARGSATSRR
jgi:NADPH-dependent 2,4-dienoyl-CoA reductase/sulfur reductase-like enzyme/nitrite reductase/ring-hydroxylating ferredoxin subunit